MEAACMHCWLASTNGRCCSVNWAGFLLRLTRPRLTRPRPRAVTRIRAATQVREGAPVKVVNWPVCDFMIVTTTNLILQALLLDYVGSAEPSSWGFNECICMRVTRHAACLKRWIMICLSKHTGQGILLSQAYIQTSNWLGSPKPQE